MTGDRALRNAWAAACLLTLLSAILWTVRWTRTGLILRVQTDEGSFVAAYRRASPDAFRIEAHLASTDRPLRAEWSGYWRVPRPGFAALVLKASGAASVELDGVPLIGTDSILRPASGGIPPGSHHVRITYRTAGSARSEMFLKGITADGRSVPMERAQTTPSQPSPLLEWAVRASRLLPLAALLAWTAVLIQSLRRGGGASVLRRAPILGLCLVVLAAALLRFEALVFRYWGVEAPGWAEALADDIRLVRPGAFEHSPTRHPYEGDPFSYLTIARSMGSFYEPSAREPLFPALTRVAVSLAGGHDIGINFLSALASALGCAAIFALGSRILSPWSGLLAAGLWAFEWQVTSFSVEGWRDDLFSLQVALCAALLVGLYQKAGRLGAGLLGVIGGLTLLTRLSAFTFLAPGLFAAILLPGARSRAERLRAGGIALAGMLLLAGPFMASCALGYGDPFYSVNVHAAFYQRRAGLPGGSGSSALAFLARSHSPWEFLETGFVGLTSYPFLNKWSGFGAWLPRLDDGLRFLSLAGLPVILFRSGGLIALLVLFSSIAPYAWTWGIPGGGEWRFTLPAYAFYLVSAAAAIEAGIGQLARIGRPASRRAAGLRALRYAVTLALGVAGWMWARAELHWLRVGEATRAGRPALIEPGSAARRFFRSGWREVKTASGGSVLVMSGAEARLNLPLTAARSVRLTLRLGADEDPASVDLFAGSDRVLSISGPHGQGETVGTSVEGRQSGRDGVLELRFVRSPPARDSASLTLLWVRIEPSTLP